ncbi:MAG: hypothetical protein ACTSR8_20915 [Promethearchaeota archaeon]
MIFLFSKGNVYETLKHHEYMILSDRIIIFEERKIMGSDLLFKHYYSTLRFQDVKKIRILHLKPHLAHIEFISDYIKGHSDEVYYYKEVKANIPNPFEELAPQQEDIENQPLERTIRCMQEEDRVTFYYVTVSEDLLALLKERAPNKVQIQEYKTIPFRNKLRYWRKLRVY